MTSLSDPEATASAFATATILRAQPAQGRVLSGTWVPMANFSGFPSGPNPGFQEQFQRFYLDSGGYSGSGFPFIMGINDFIYQPGSWRTYLGDTIAPHCRAGGLCMLMWTAVPYSGCFGSTYPYIADAQGDASWPIMGTGSNTGLTQDGKSSDWSQGLGVVASGDAFTISSQLGFDAGTGTIPCSTATSNFPTAGFLMVITTTGYTIVRYSGTDAGGFTGCTASALGGVVKAKYQLIDYALFVPGSPQNVALNYSLDDLDAELVFLDSLGIAPVLRILAEPGAPKLSYLNWYLNTPTPYYQLAWVYHWNYITGNAAEVVGWANGAFTMVAQPVVSSGINAQDNSIRPTHNALWAFTDTGVTSSYSQNFICAPAGYVDVVGCDYYTSSPESFPTINGSPSGSPHAQWDEIMAYYWPADPVNAIIGFSESGYKGRSGSALDWLPALTTGFIASDGVTAYGPSFFMSWQDQYSSKWSPFDKSDFAQFWNNPPLQNLKPGAWPMAPQRAGFFAVP